MKVRELKDLNVEELQTKIVDQRKQIVDLRFQLAMRKLESPAKLRTAKKTLARMLTIQTEKVDKQIKETANK
ncbi:MAG TPA: 50S ribosomal protein L29 [Verrucomicrobiae bacterium]|jgi:large subunit ribosomal protein L29|nr:50S ribosomal protein L29 [Verrucomicrobiae bacterium]